jgi:hypothetical protein
MSKAFPYIKSFRLTKQHKILLTNGIYAKYAGLLIRLFLDSYMSGEQSLVMARFKREVSKIEKVA